MKKVLSILMVLALCVAMLTMFAGCGSEADKLVGTWKAEVDMTDMINEELAADPALAEYFNISSFCVIMTMTFNEDGTYSTGIDADSVSAAMLGLVTDMERGIYAMFEAEIEASGLDMAVEELLELSGVSMEDLLSELTYGLESGMVDEIVSEAAMSGNFEVKGDKLFLSDGLDYAVDPAVYEVFTLEGDTLTLVENVGAEDDSFGLYPVVFTRS